MSNSTRPPTADPTPEGWRARQHTRDDGAADALGPAIRVGAKALVTDGDRVLLVEERRDDGSSFWTLPGGGVKWGETLQTCLRRELTEELQCDTAVGEAVTTCSYRHTTAPVVTVYTVFEAAVAAEPTPNPSEGVVDCVWSTPGDLPATTLEPMRTAVEMAVGGPSDEAGPFDRTG